MGFVGQAVIAAVILTTSPFATGKVCNVSEYGAKGDGHTKDTAAVQRAIDACSSATSRGSVIVHAGTYVIAPVVLKSNVALHLDKGATLLGSPDMADYPPDFFMGLPVVQPLLSAKNATDISIDGEGTIDGNGRVWWESVRNVKDAGVVGIGHPRPMLLVFDHSSHIRMSGVTVQNSGFWQIVPVYSRDLVFRDMHVLAPKSPNTDGIDPTSSTEVVIDRVFISVGDDDIAIKSGENNGGGPFSPSANITVTDCTFAKGHGLSIGSGVAGGVRGVRVARIHFIGTTTGLRIKSARDRGNDVSNITFRDIAMENVPTAIMITEYYPNPAPKGEVPAAPVTPLTPKFHGITIENLKAVGSESVGMVAGLPESPVRKLALRNVEIHAQHGMTVAYASVTMEHVKLMVNDGKSLEVAPTATVVGYQGK